MTRSTEFYKTPDGSVMMKSEGQPVRMLAASDRDTVSALLVLIRDRYPDAFRALCDVYTRNEPNRMVYEFNIVSRFIRCNCGEYDTNTMDIDADGFFHFEQVGCPLRGNECLHEGCICNPRLDTRLSDRELEVVELIARGLQTQEVADALSISPLTVNRHRENIKARLGMRTVAQLAAWYAGHVRKKD